MAGNDRHGAELAHGPRRTQQHAIEQSPLDIGQGDAEEDVPAARAEGAGGDFLVGALVFHQRDQFAGDERQGNEDGGQHQARQGEDDLDVMVTQQEAEPALGAE